MLRTMLTLLLIPGVLLTQFAAVPHAHGTDAGPHPAHPHFHFHQLNPASAARGAAPARGGTAHAPRTPALTAADSDPHADHDADAVYVDAGAAAHERFDHGRAESHPLVALVPTFPLDFLRSVVARPVPPPARAAERCPLYVRHLTLTV